MCQKHPNFQIQFLQVKGIKEDKNKQIFYCIECINEDFSFQGINYLLVHHIIDQGNDQIIQKWPPIDDIQIIEELIKQTKQNQQPLEIEKQITSFFTELKKEILQKIDLCQKRMVNSAQQLTLDNVKTIKQYQEISKIGNLRQYLISGDTYTQEKQDQCRILIEQIYAEKEIIQEQLKTLLHTCIERQNQIDLESPQQMKKIILNSIDQIRFFKDPLPDTTQKVVNYQINDNSGANVEILMKLISNKSNYCSDNFLNQIKQMLAQIDPLIQQIQFENAFKQKKQPIDFSGLGDEELELLYNYTIHAKELKINPEYKQKIENSFEIQLINSMYQNLKFCFDEDFNSQIQQFYQHSYPFLLHFISFKNIIKENQKERFDCLNKASIQNLNDLLRLQKKTKDLQKKKYNSSYSYQVLQKIIKYLDNYQQSDVEELFKKYPIFDLLQPISVYGIKNFQLIKTNYNNELNRLQISINESFFYEAYLREDLFCYTNCVSNIILDKDKKYVFRIKIELLQPDQEQQYILLGLVQDSKMHIQDGYNDKLSCCLENNQNQIIRHNYDNGIQKQLKGDKFVILEDDLVEMRVSIKDQILELTDYPNYKNRIGISDLYKTNLINYSNFRLYIGLLKSQSKVIIQYAQAVNIF